MMNQKIYDQHRAAFANVSAYVILDKNGERVATVAFKYPRDGAGRLYAYVHIMGIPMIRGFAAGGGYDKGSAAVAHAVAKMCESDTPAGTWPLTVALSKDDGYHWDQNARKAGFTVLQAV